MYLRLKSGSVGKSLPEWGLNFYIAAIKSSLAFISTSASRGHTETRIDTDLRLSVGAGIFHPGCRREQYY